jgi:predicted GNAT superfamily acetyltransferase
MIRPRIKSLDRHSEFDECVVIQKKVWHHSAGELTPAHQFCVGVATGSILLGAYVGSTLAGFVYSFPALFQGRLCQHSHLLAVLPRYQGYGLGKLLKWAQHDRALELGYDLMTWTYDPLRVRNASLNLHTLGAESRIYLGDFYGRVPSLVFAPGTPSDRLKVEWRLGSDRVERRRRAAYPAYDIDREDKLLEAKMRLGRPEPGPVRSALEARRLLVEIPAALMRHRHEPRFILDWQRALRRSLSGAFARGYRATDFIFGPRCFYVLEEEPSGRRRQR